MMESGTQIMCGCGAEPSKYKGVSMERITSRKNPLCLHIRRLSKEMEYRHKCREFLCDGWKLLEEALQWSGEIRTVICVEGAALPDLPTDVRIVRTPEELMAYLSPSKTPQGVLTVCGIPTDTLPRRLVGQRYAVLDTVQDPGNVGTILRAAAAFQADGLFLLSGCADAYGPKAVRASMGAVFRLPVWNCCLPNLTALLSDSRIPLYGAALRGNSIDVREWNCPRAAIAIGSEGHGLSEEVLEQCCHTIRIPMDGRCESLNAAQAAAILLWELWKQNP